MTDIQEIHVKPEAQSLQLNFIASSYELFRRGFHITMGAICAVSVFGLIVTFIKSVVEALK